ncbi:hypothetical protein GGI15_004175 [Coemansia interrupta]|uniref:Uncharacterized protein n=1 Tax=Coemansia interrupta TaxID=1126814 RepID=A0A9W8LFJ8_9FUNG|nr:hypothetical protein GGI15_004175 [Coemansia interrupta]
MRSYICLRVLLALATTLVLALAAMGYPVSDTTANNSPVDTSGNSNTTDISESMDRIFTTLVEHTFGPQHLDHADLYYKTRFFASHMQARMRFIATQTEAESEDNADSGDSHGEKTLSLTQPEAEQLNSIMKEMWLASRKLYQSWGCMSYDLTLCSGKSSSKSSKFSDADKEAMVEWEKRLATPFVAGKRIQKDQAEDIRGLMQQIHTVLLAHTASST